MALNTKIIGQRIKYYREQRNLSQEELGTLVFSSREHINRIETGSRTPSLEGIVMISNVLEVTANDLLADNLIHASPVVDEELNEIFDDCNRTQKGILIKTILFLKTLLSEYRI